MSLMSDYREELKNKGNPASSGNPERTAPLCNPFFRGIAQTTSAKPVWRMPHDLRIFFRYLYEEHRTLGGIEPKDLTQRI